MALSKLFEESVAYEIDELNSVGKRIEQGVADASSAIVNDAENSNAINDDNSSHLRAK